MSTGFEIISSSRNKIVLGIKKEQFFYLKFDRRYLKSNAFNLAILASAAYQSKEDVETFLFEKNKPGDRNFIFTDSGNVHSGYLFDSLENAEKIQNTYNLFNEESTDTQFFHYETNEYLLLAFRGTEPKKADVFTDVNVQMVPFSDVCGMVHAGFHIAFKSIQNAIDKVVKKAHGKKVIFCGHSLGGALAVMAAAYTKKIHKREVMLYTFGCPLVGDTDFTYHCSKVDPIIYWRCVHNEDIVTMIPPPHTHLRINILKLSAINPFFLIPATIDPFGKPFNQMGKVVFLRRIDHKTFSVDVDRKTPIYIRVPNTIPIKELIEERPKWEKLLNWLGASTADHSITNYVSILGSDFKHAINSYLHASLVTAENSKKIIEYLEAELKSLRSTRTELENKLMMPSGGIVYYDATSTGSTPSNKLTPTQKMCLLDDALQTKQMELVMQKAFVANAKSPAYKEAILKEITDLKMSPTLKRELEYQSKNIKF